MINSIVGSSEVTREMRTLVDLLRARATRQAGQRVYTFLTDDAGQEIHLTYGELDRRARSIAATLQSLQGTGERALLLAPPGLDYIASFFGCLYAGVIAVPMYPPDPARLERTLPRIQMMATDAQAKLVLTTEAILNSSMFKFAPELGALHWITVDTLQDDHAEQWQVPAIGPDNLAFLQYTSGSTRAPRGVMLTHDNLLHNTDVIARAFEMTPDDVGVIWLPPYHDMGLIGGLLQPVCHGFPCILMTPVSFLQRPLRWLQAISRYGGTISGGPNFAYDLCVRRITPDERAMLDLSSWGVAFNGAEPVRHETLERFAAAFAPSGFRYEAFSPCYGLAESTLMISSEHKPTRPAVYTIKAAALEQNQAVSVAQNGDRATTLVGTGPTRLEQVVIVNPETGRPCPPHQIGEIWVTGNSVAQGYWNNPEETEYTFRARLAGTGEGPFLRTGDLGFLKDDTLFITGRLKDLIIIDGRNHYPQDLELTVEESHPALRSGCSAAFAVENAGEERLVVVAEVERRFLSAQRKAAENPAEQSQAAAAIEDVVAAVRQAVTEQHNVRVHTVVLLKTGHIPKTTSGKIQRRACRKGFLDGTLAVIGTNTLEESVAVPEEQLNSETGLMRSMLATMDTTGRQLFLEAYLRTQVALVLRLDPARIDLQEPLSKLGLDSVAVGELTSNFETQFGVLLSAASLLRGDSITQLVAQILSNLTEREKPQPSHPAYDEHAGRTTLPVDIATSTPESSVEIPLSYGQHALWFLQQLVPDSPAYNIVNVVRIPAEIDIPALQRAFHKLAERHPILRAAFITRDKEPVQLLLPQREIVVQVEDIASWSPAQLNERLALEVYRPFDLEHEPLVRTMLFSRSPQDHLCIFVMHHIVTDLWSMAIITHEINLLYQAEKTGRTPKLKTSTRQYTDYIRWQREMLAAPEGEKLRSYWQQQLSGELAPLNLPTDRPRPPVPSYRGATQTIRIGAELTRSLRSLARAHGATLFMTVLAAFQVLLYRYSGQEDILVGSPWAGRRRQWAGLIGYFVNPLVLRADLSMNPTFTTFLAQVRQTVLDGFEHADYPFSLLVRQLQPERELSRSPIFQVMFSWQKTTQLVSGASLTSFALNEAGGRLGSDEFPLESVALDQRVAPFDITLFMGEAGDELVATMEYSTDLFDAQTIQRMLQHFQQLLEGIANNPEQTVTNVPLLSPPERYQILIEWNATKRPYPQDICLHQLIAEQSSRTPDAHAVVFEGRTLTYADLDQRANQLAHQLLSLGIVPDTPVALCVERSLEMIVGLLGILKAGAAYLPLDPFYPADRLAFMLQDSQAPILLTQQHIDHRPWTASAGPDADRQRSIIYLDRDWETIAQQPGTYPDSTVTAEHLAYIIYTSGSTGQPKGAMISHRAIVNRLLWMQEAYQLTPADRVLQKTPFTFDVSVWEFFWPLLTGACLVVARPEGHKDTPYLVDIIDREQITTLHFVPPMLQVFLTEADTTRCHTLRRVICSGEALPFELQQRFYALLDAELHNLYGPTEAAVDVSFWACERFPSRSIVPIGQPVANTQLYVLDSQLQPVPIGVAGELHIGGVQLARGYLNRPDLTAEKFIPDPFSAQPGARLYKTGDLARYLPDGTIEYLGRLDHQVKVRGFRIELGEIEALLGQHPAVREVVVLAREDTPGHKRLVAYLVIDQQPAPGVRELRQFVQERLPEYMVPSAFVILDVLPLTPNGKVNRRALPKPEDDRSGLEAAYLAPRTPVEIALASIWSQVLGVEQVGVHDNFFERGGDSILSIQVVGRANRAGLRLTPQQIFQFPTLGQLAAVTGSGPAIQAEQGLVEGEVPLTPIQHWFFEQNLPEPDHWNQAVLLEVRQPLTRDLLTEIMRHLLWHHDALRMQFTHDGEYWRQINTTQIDPEALVRWIDLAAVPVAEQDTAVESTAAEMQGSLNLASGTPVRAVYFDLGTARPGCLLFIIHHLVIDGVSWRILLEDFQTIYQQIGQGQPAQLPPKTSAFQQWAQQLADYAQTAAAHSELDDWLSLTRAAIRSLPLDHPGGTGSEASARQVRIMLEADETRMLLQQVPAVYGTSINDVLLTALAQALAGWTGQRTLLVDLEGHGREDLFADIDLSRTVGWFTTLYPVVLSLPEATDPGALLIALKEQLHRIPQRGIGYGVLRYLSDAKIADQMRMLPSAEVRFNYLGQFDQNYAESVLFAPSTGNYGPLHSPHGHRSYLLEIDAMVRDGMFQIEWTYSQAQYERETIEHLAETFVTSLRHILSHCTARDTRVYTPSDFPLAGLNQNQLDTISAKVHKALKRGSR